MSGFDQRTDGRRFHKAPTRSVLLRLHAAYGCSVLTEQGSRFERAIDVYADAATWQERVSYSAASEL